MSFSYNLGLFMAFSDGKIKRRKLAKFKTNPLQKWSFLVNFLRRKKVSKFLNMKVNSLKCRFRLI